MIHLIKGNYFVQLKKKNAWHSFDFVLLKSKLSYRGSLWDLIAKKEEALYKYRINEKFYNSNTFLNPNHC